MGFLQVFKNRTPFIIDFEPANAGFYFSNQSSSVS